MKPFIFAAALAAIVAFSSADVAQASQAGKKVLIDVNASQLKWEGKKVTGQHHGEVKLKSGELILNGKDLSGGQFVIDLSTITNQDLTDPGYNAKLTTHLKGEDFFNVAQYPTATLVIKSVKAVEGLVGPTFEVTADLTMRGKTNEIQFPAVVETKAGKTTAKASIQVDRTRWDLRYGSGKFFQGLGDKMINDIFKLDVAISSQ